MYGVRDIWDNSSLHIRESGVSGFPSRELSHGTAAQIQWRNLYADIEALSIHGSTGEKQKIWYDFSGWSLGARVDYRIPAHEMSHYIRGSYAFRTQDNDENVLEDVTENGVTTTRKYGANTIYTRQNIRTGLEWEVLLDTGEYFNAGVTWSQDREVSTLMYPFVNTCRTDVFGIYAAFLLKSGRIDWKARVAVSKGKDNEVHGRTSGIDVTGEPFRLDEYEAWMTAYKTCLKGDAEMAVRYNFRKGVYVEGAYEVLRRLKGVSGVDFGNDNYRYTATLRVGYNF